MTMNQKILMVIQKLNVAITNINRGCQALAPMDKDAAEHFSYAVNFIANAQSILQNEVLEENVEVK